MTERTKQKTHSVEIAQHDALPEAWRGLIFCFAVFFAAMWMGFGNSISAKFMIVISILYCLMYFGLPWCMFRIRDKYLHKLGQQPSNKFSGAGQSAQTGLAKNNDTVIQILTIPAALAVAAVAFAVVNMTIR